MAVFKCKMCGATLEIEENQSIAICKYCGSQQTLPKIDDEKKIALFNRANNLRFKSEFDKAAGIYESIVSEFPDEAEAYWGLVLCKYGIEYVDDPATGRKVPTCHRTVTTSVLDDEDFELACENADISAKMLYREEAKAINDIQKKILEIVATEEPYDIFICYKETDPVTGLRTDDSTIAQDVYTELIKEGYKVFFARVTLRDKAGSEYEPYIYSALSSAKVMLAFGTKFEYFDAVWVKNEWSRYLSMMATDKTKHFIACYKDLVAEDIPKEFRQLQALNINDVTFIKSLFANIEGFISRAVKETVPTINTGSATADSLLKRAFMFLEDEEWDNANNYFEKVLDIDPECAKAYLGKLMVELRVKNESGFSNMRENFETNKNYQKILAFGDDSLKSMIKEALDRVKSEVLNSECSKGNERVCSELESRDFIIEDGVLKKYLGSIDDVVIPDSVVEIGEGCFNGLKINSVTIPDSVTIIGDSAFAGCTELTSITIPNSITNIGSDAFYDCYGIEVVCINDIANWCDISFDINSESNPLYHSGDLYLNGELVTNLVIPNGVRTIGCGVFANCTSITSVTIPDSVTTIGVKAFDDCTYLKSITLGERLERIDDVAFSGCKRLESIVIPDSVTDIGGCAFMNCTSLTSVTIGKNVVNIGEYAFSSCNKLEKIYWNAKRVIGFSSSSSVIYDAGTLGSGIELIFGNEVERIPAYLCFDASHSCTIKSVSIGKRVKSIGKAAFKGCTKLASVTIPDSVTNIEEEAFSDCERLTTVTIGNGIKSISKSVFSGSYKIQSLNIPDSLIHKCEGDFLNSLIYKKSGLCQHCGGSFKSGLFSVKCTKCGKPKDY